MDKRRITGKYLLYYTAFFALLSAAAFLPFALGGKCMVGDGDGQSQYILQLAYMGRWLRNALGGILHGDFTPPRFDFTIGMGDDICSVVRFHPLDFLAVFVPESGTEVLYQFLNFLRMYLAGLAFSLYAFAWRRHVYGPESGGRSVHDQSTGVYVRNTEERSEDTGRKQSRPESGSFRNGDHGGSWGVLAGSMVYLFTGYTFSLGIVHPTYLSPLITLPLLLLGAERMMHRDEEHRFVLFTAITAISFISNYYFMYIASVAAVLYVFVRFFQIYTKDRVRQFIILFLRFVCAYGTGLLISCVTLLPVLKRYAQSYRSERLTAVGNLFVYADKRRYAAWLINLISPLRASGNGTHLNYAVLVIPAFLLLFAVRKKHEDLRERQEERTFLRIASAVLLAFLLIPAGGFLMAALNNENNRWVFLIALMCAGVVSFSFPDFFRLGKREKTVLAAGCIVYDLAVGAAFLWMGPDVYPAAGAVQLTLTTVLLLLLSGRVGNRLMCTFLTIVCLISSAVNGWMTFAPEFGNLTRYYRDAGDSLDWYRDSVYSGYLKIPGIGESGFARVDGVFRDNKEDNASLALGYQGIQMYNSVMNASEIDALMDTANAGLTTMLHIRSLDGRTAAEEIAGVRWFMASPDCSGSIPYGYSEEPVYSDSRISIYENEHPMPLSFGTDTVMSESEYEKLSYAQREYVCLEAAVVEDEAAKSYEGPVLTAQEFASSLADETFDVKNCRPDEGIAASVKEDGSLSFKVKKKSSRYRFDVEMKGGCACYLVLEGLSSGAASKLYVESEDIYESVTLLTEDETYTLLRSDYLVNLGYSKEDREKEVTLRFSKKGTYDLDRLKVVCIPLGGYEEKVSSLASHTLEEETIEDDLICGRAVWEESGVQLFSVPYSEGWSAEIDGKEEKLLCADGCWTGLFVPQGEHEIRLSYHAPMFTAGALCSVAGLILLVFGAAFSRFLKKKRRKG